MDGCERGLLQSVLVISILSSIYMYLFGVIFIKDVYALKTPLKNIDDPISEWGSSSRLI